MVFSAVDELLLSAVSFQEGDKSVFSSGQSVVGAGEFASDVRSS